MKVELKKMKTENGNRIYGIKTEIQYEEEINWMKVEHKEIETENMDKEIRNKKEEIREKCRNDYRTGYKYASQQIPQYFSGFEENFCTKHFLSYDLLM